MNDAPASKEQLEANLALSHEIIKLFMRDDVEPDNAVDALCLAIIQTYISRYARRGVRFIDFLQSIVDHCVTCKEEFDAALIEGNLKIMTESEGKIN